LIICSSIYICNHWEGCFVEVFRSFAGDRFTETFRVLKTGHSNVFV
jgi:hypothetical protein